MKHEGPQLEALTHRLTETPTEFLAEPRVGNLGAVHVDAVLGDLIRSWGGLPAPAQLMIFTGNDAKRDRNRLAVALILSWLLADEWFRQARTDPGAVLTMLDGTARELAAQTAARSFITDPDRREELARTALARLDLRPAGETEAQAQDRLISLSATERQRVIAAARAAEERARAVRESLARKAAEESADKFTRE
jgi:hypothetical protein